MSLIKLLTEKKGDSYEYGCVSLRVDFPVMKKIHAAIDPEDLYEETGDRTYGIEDETHVTLLYGIHDGVPVADVKAIIDEFTFSKIKAYNISVFEKEEYDVLKFDVKSPELNRVNKALTELPHTNDYPDYHPHISIAYLQPGAGKKYIKALKKLEINIKPTYVEYSDASGRESKIPIKLLKKA